MSLNSLRMHRSNSRACLTYIRNFTYSQHIVSVSNSNNLLNDVCVLTTRGNLKEALSLFYNTPKCHHSKQVYATLFHECAKNKTLDQGQRLHEYMLLQNPNNPPDLYVTNHLINMYAKCGDIEFARKLFDEMPVRNLVSWTALVSGYAQHGDERTCFSVFKCMLGDYRPNEFAFASVIGLCDYLHGKQVHSLALKVGLDGCVYVGSALITMYSRNSGSADGYTEAWSVFKTVRYRGLSSWNSMMNGFQHCGLGERVISLFSQMHHEGIGFDRATLLSLFSSLYGNIDDLKYLYQLHCLTIKTGFISEMKVATALVKIYGNIVGEVENCYQLFTETNHRDIVLWTSIITAFSEQAPEKSLYFYRQLLNEGLTPDPHTFSIVLKACAGFITEQPASAIHSQIIKAGLEEDTIIGNALIHAYARCGALVSSKLIFEKLAFRDLVSWNSMLKAYALHGDANTTLQLFSQMNVKPDSATIVAVLSACSHAGMVEEGTKIFDSMLESYGVVPQLDHYACMVDILGRAGLIYEAEKLINRMPMEPDAVIWSVLLASCRKHGETRLAMLAAEKLNKLQPRNSLGFVQLSNLYSLGGSFNKAGLVRKEMDVFRVRKEPGLSLIQIGNQVHEFASGGQRHPLREAIFIELKGLIGKLKAIGYVPETTLALHDTDIEQKEEQLYHHSEKLALAFATMNGVGARVVKIVKNIRICVDCHNFMKLASDLLQKEIIVRDSNRFHHFKDNKCSCNDYW
ncbi:hypothetical protein ACFE04_017387 [Oxalis oulophora]